MKQINKYFATFLLAVCAAGISGCSHTDNSELIYSQVKSVDKLVLGQMTISKMATVDDIDLSKASGLKQMTAGVVDALKIGNRKAAYSYDTYLRAYIDLSTLTPEDIKINESSKTAEIVLPAIQTEFAGRDMQIREDHYRVTGMRSEIDAEERAEIKERMNTALKDEVEKKDTFRNLLTDAAKAKGRKYFENLFAANGYKVTVNFK